MIHSERIASLNTAPIQHGQYVVYWMQAAQRATWNHALEYAIEEANHLKVPLIVYLELLDHFPESNLRHYTFMLEGLIETKDLLAKRHIPLIIHHATEGIHLQALAKKACLVITDVGYTRFQREWRRKYATTLPCAMRGVETNVIVPVEVASPKLEFSAATFRPKISKLLSHYLQTIRPKTLKHPLSHGDIPTFAITSVAETLKHLRLDTTVAPSPLFSGGYTAAKYHLRHFIQKRLGVYATTRNDPSLSIQSNMSPYLHFGQISPLEIALAIKDSGIDGSDAYLEEMIVRRELAVNYTYYNPHYDELKGIPTWAKKSLMLHLHDERPYLYTLDQLERAQTHDRYWNAGQDEMRITGKMHGYMRMYWGKKLIEWTKTPEDAMRSALYFNNKYELDGRDPNGFTGIAWCFGTHDRPWKERAIFGKVRYMNDKGLERKCDIDQYVHQIRALKEISSPVK